MHHKINDHMAEESDQKVYTELKMWVYPNLRWQTLSLTFSFKFIYFCILHIWTLRKEFC